MLNRREFLAGAAASAGAAARRPNIVYLLCDDLGYGDVHCLNPKRGRIPTPNIDRLAGQGMIFTDAHSGSSVCTPTRYGVYTGRYAWRSTLQSGVYNGYSPPLIPEGRLTVASLLKTHGYHTALIGKWHLGWGWARVDERSRPAHLSQVKEEQLGYREGDVLTTAQQQALDGVDYGKPIRGGPAALGFDTFYGLTAPDFPPFVWIENDRVTAPPTMVKRVIRLGVGQREYEAERLLPELTRRAVGYIEDRKAAKDGRPFFLAFTLTAPHSPLVPAKEWRGRSGMGLYGDWVMQADAAAGEVLRALERTGMARDTMVVFTSDNGCATYVGLRDEFGEDVAGRMRRGGAVRELEEAGHFPSAGYRGYKADTWDGGHRVPFIVRWPGKVRPGSTSGQMVCLTDLMATCAEMLDARLPANAGEDSVSMLPAFGGGAGRREAIVHHSVSGKFAVRQGRWKLMLSPGSGSGGWSAPNDAAAARQGLPPLQLFDMVEDPGERRNLLESRPEIAARLVRLLETYVENGRSTPGPKQSNDTAVDIWKGTSWRRP